MADSNYSSEYPFEEESTEDESVYEEQSREELVDAGSISSEEDAFMKGYEEDSENKEDEVY